MKRAYSACERTPGYEWCMEHRSPMPKKEHVCEARAKEIAEE